MANIETPVKLSLGEKDKALLAERSIGFGELVTDALKKVKKDCDEELKGDFCVASSDSHCDMHASRNTENVTFGCQSSVCPARAIDGDESNRPDYENNYPLQAATQIHERLEDLASKKRLANEAIRAFETA